jgi:hypothetical protein
MPVCVFGVANPAKGGSEALSRNYWTGNVFDAPGVKHSGVHYDQLALSKITDYKRLVIFDPSCENCQAVPGGGH